MFRLYRDESVRDRSQSLCPSSTTRRAPPHKDIGALRILQRRASSVISSATELISRRGLFSKQNYNLVNHLTQTELDGIDLTFKRFRVENGESAAEKDEVFGSPSAPILENPEHQTRWYFKYFLGKLHHNYVGIDSEKNPYFLSVVMHDAGNQGTPLYRAILFRKQGTQKIVLPYQFNQKLTVKQILGHFSAFESTLVQKNPKEIMVADIQKDLLLLEEQEGSVNFKFGVIYMRTGQTCDDEMLSNDKPSEEFEHLLNILGERIRLKGWDRFRGGLDVKSDMTGKYSLYTLYEGHEIMFHVSTLLPFSKDNRQQVERKRHIGNDIVNIIFIDSNNPATEDDKSVQHHNQGQQNTLLPKMFDPVWIKSQFTHVFAVITRTEIGYRLAIFCDENVPAFGPTLPNPPEFEDDNIFREFLLVKLINAEKATFQTPLFAKKRERTLEMLIKDLHEDYVSDNKLIMLNRRAFSEVLYDAPKTSKIKEDARQIEFVRIGQALKLEAIVKGDAPTSIASASPCTIFKKPPWEPHCFYPAFNHHGHPLVGDSFGPNDENLVIASNDGTFLIKDDHSVQLIFDKSVSVRQLSVIEEHSLLLMRCSSHINREAQRIYVFRLKEFQAIIPEVSTEVDCPQLCRNYTDIKERRIEKTRGCHLYATSRSSGGYTRLLVATGRKLLIFQWKYSAAWTFWCLEKDIETAEGFNFLKEINLHDTPTIITPLEGATSEVGKSGLICIGYRHHYEIVCDQSGSIRRLYEVDLVKRNQAQLTAAIELCDGLETEILLCYNHTCHFQKLNAKQEDDRRRSSSSGSSNGTGSSVFDFHWNTSPTNVVCAFPYIFGFTADSMEIRLLVNGNLVHTEMLPELQLITSKRDIFYVTTSPEFMPNEDLSSDKDRRTQLEYLLTPTNINSNNRSQHLINNINSSEGAEPLEKNTTTAEYLIIPPSINVYAIQRVRSLQKERQMERIPLISKSKSCCEENSRENSNENNDNNRLRCDFLPTGFLASQSSNDHNSLIGEKGRAVKPLRIYRIPLTKLTGDHAHFNMQSFSALATPRPINLAPNTNTIFEISGTKTD